MPYHVSLPLRKPYLPGVKVLDDQSALKNLNIRHNGDLITFGMSNGVPLDPEIVPKRFEIEISASQMPGIISLAIAWGVTEVFRDKLEEFEPGVHQFFPADIWAKGGERPNRRYWVMNVCNRVDAIDPEKSVMRSKYDGRYYDRYGLGEGEEAKLVFDKSIVAEKCMWVDRRFAGGFFICDELLAFVKENKLAKLETWKVYTE